MTVEELRAKNPELPVYSVNDPEFLDFGRVIDDFDVTSLCETAKVAAKMPEKGVRYVPFMEELEALPVYADVKRVITGENPVQIGCCWGYNTRLGSLEYHRASEFNVAVTDLVLLLAPRAKMIGNDLQKGNIKAFFVPKGTLIEVFATSLHFAPCMVNEEGFICLVILPKGTNYPLKEKHGCTKEDKILAAADKWLITCESNEAGIARGMYPGIHDEDYDLKF